MVAGREQMKLSSQVSNSLLSGLLAWEGSRLVLRQNKLDLIDEILAQEPNFLASVDPIRYLADFYTGTSLPFDSTGFAIQQIQALVKELASLSQTTPPEALAVSPYMPIQDLEQIRYRLADQLERAREEDFAIQQAQGDRVQEIISLLDLLQNARKARNEGIFDPPAFLEWAVWRAFLAIDKITMPIQETRRFPLDQDLRPRDTAPANRADMIFEFDDFILVVEVTLTRAGTKSG
jgi:hypothetical protein